MFGGIGAALGGLLGGMGGGPSGGGFRPSITPPRPLSGFSQRLPFPGSSPGGLFGGMSRGGSPMMGGGSQISNPFAAMMKGLQSGGSNPLAAMMQGNPFAAMMGGQQRGGLPNLFPSLFSNQPSILGGLRGMTQQRGNPLQNPVMPQGMTQRRQPQGIPDTVATHIKNFLGNEQLPGVQKSAELAGGALSKYLHNSNVNINGINSKLLERLPDILSALEAKGYQPRIASGMRSIEQQREKVRKGYSKTMNSRHLHGGAVDIIDKRWGWNVPKGNSFWKDLGEIVKSQGLEWGGSWKSFYDPAHVQLRRR